MRFIRSCLPALFCTASLLILQAQSKNSFKIAFGSCSHQQVAEQMWGDVLKQKPNLWVWIGDNIYATSHNVDSFQVAYNVQKIHPDYQNMMRSIPIIGTWDDHDYGVNDGGKFFGQKKKSKEKLLEFLDIPADAEVRKHEGVYQSYSYGEDKKRVKVILLDARYFRDTLAVSPEKGKRYVTNLDGDILGEEQWNWLERELRNSDAQVNIIGSSIQFLANEHSFEKWGNFPKARQRMLDLLVAVKPAYTLFVSGDRHIAEISKLTLPGLRYPLYDFTSSGLTHTWEEPWVENNSLRVGKLIIEKNYGIINIDWNKHGPIVTLQVRGNNNALFAEEKLDF